MTMIAPEEAATDLADPTRRIEGGEIALTRDGKPVLDLVPHRRKGGLDLEGVKPTCGWPAWFDGRDSSRTISTIPCRRIF